MRLIKYLQGIKKYTHSLGFASWEAIFDCLDGFLPLGMENGNGVSFTGCLFVKAALLYVEDDHPKLTTVRPDRGSLDFRSLNINSRNHFNLPRCESLPPKTLTMEPSRATN
jgi:hypothetical protein